MEQTISQQPKWSQSNLIAFRFFFAYFFLYIFPFPLGFIPYFGVLLQPLFDLLFSTINEISKIFFGSVVSAGASGSGDSAFNYSRVFLFAFYSIIITIGWSFLDRKRNDYEKLLYWLSILLRYYLAVAMLSYGLAKIFKTQFPFPSLERLNQTYGESSPMALLWTFMGYSAAYNIFTGLGEFIGGSLLFFKRTRLLGALIVIAVMSHVVVLNFAYDVPVKLFSLHLLAMAIFLAVPDVTRLVKLFLLNEPVEAEPIKPIYNNTKTRWMYMIGKGLLIIYIVVADIMGSMEERKHQKEYFKTVKANQSLGGEYEVATFILNGHNIPSDSMVTRRWKRILINERNAIIETVDGAAITWLCHGNLNYKKMMLISPDLSTTGNFRFQDRDTTLIIQGIFNVDSVKIIANRKSNNPFLLVDREFHWISEFPFFR